ncbi:MAG: HDOD domain-containing protein [Gammaproteobacteria bacterium]|nr:HDOD domain-containing protein [Gammaproteobacteria bacterium]MDP2142148.1 HDOD domain-containing protein [Gammaproteobacteria bacterium]MDP2348244.1 HDOD domain-containing protein [Gammaproteobacteria bacterium]
MSRTHQQITEHLLDLIDTDELILPTLPEVALRIREVANDPNVSTRELSELLGSDPAISARLIRIANSPLMRSMQRIDSLPAAINRLGMSYSCNLVMGLAMEQLFQATSDVVDDRLRQVWQHSTELAAVASVLAQHYTRLKPDQATLAALVHEIGVLPVLAYVEEHDLYTRWEESAELDQLIAVAHPVLGERILSAWRFPDNLLMVPLEHVNQQRVVDKVDYVDIVIVAKLQCQSDGYASLPEEDWHTVSAFSRLGLNANRDVLEATGLSEEMQANLSAWQ